MKKNFWQKLNKPFFVLAPMADVTDRAFRRVIAKYGKPDVTWTEFVSADGLAHPKAREKLLVDLEYTESERPIVAQLFTSNPDNMRTAAKLCAELGFDGIDINMGCPDKSIEKQGAGACMIKSPDIAMAVIAAAREGAGGLPVSVKTRIGYNKNEIETWIKTLLEQKLPALTVHLRTRKEMSQVDAHWDLMPEILKLRDEIAPETLIIGNGDVKNMDDAREKASTYKCDGVMIGRAIFGNPWLFGSQNSNVSKNASSRVLGSIHQTTRTSTFSEVGNEPGFETHKYWLHEETNIPKKEKLKVLLEHAELFDELLGDVKSFAIMKKHFKAYVHGWEGAKELRMELMNANNVAEVRQIITNYLK